MDVNTATTELKSLASFIGTKRESFEEYDLEASILSDRQEYEFESQRKRKINVRLAALDCVQTPEVEQTPSEKFRTRNFLPVIDQFEISLRLRLEAYQLVDNRFGFLNKLDTMLNKDIFTAAQNLLEIYNTVIDEQLVNELIQIKKYFIMNI